MLTVLTFVGCQNDRLEEIEADLNLLTRVDANQHGQIETLEIALADTTAALNAAIAENAQLTAENAALIDANMAEVDTQLAALVASDEATDAELAEIKISIEAVRTNVVVFISEQVVILNEAVAAAIADGDQAVVDALNAEIAAIELVAGPQGPAGPAGASGSGSGVAGPAGADGADGTNGSDGAQGEQGAQGTQGPAGPQGIPGANGADGDDGDDGDDGLTGPTGAQGPQGQQGPAGTSTTTTIDPADSYVPSRSAAVRSGGERSFAYNNGTEVTQFFIGENEYSTLELAQASVPAGETVQIRTLVTQPTTDNVAEIIDTVTISFTVQQNGDEDVPPLPAKADEYEITVVAVATTDDGDLLTESDTSASYTAPATANGPDTIVFGNWVLGTETGGEVTTDTAGSDVEFVTEHTAAVERIDTRGYSVDVVDAVDDPAPTPDPSELTRTVVVTAYSSRQVTNPAYVPSATITEGTATVENGAYNENTLGGDLDGDGDALDSGTWSTQFKTILTNGTELASDVANRTKIGDTYIQSSDYDTHVETETGTYNETTSGSDLDGDGDAFDSGNTSQDFDVVTLNGSENSRQSKGDILYLPLNDIDHSTAQGPATAFTEAALGFTVNSDSDLLDSGTYVESFDTIITNGVETSRVSTGILYNVTDDQSAQAGFDFSNSIRVQLGTSKVFGDAVSLYDADENLLAELIATGNQNKRIDYVFSGAGTYSLSFYADGIALGLGDATYVNFTIDADGNVSIQ